MDTPEVLTPTGPARGEPEAAHAFSRLPLMPDEVVKAIVARVSKRAAESGLGFSDADGPLVLYAMENGYRTPLSASREASLRDSLIFGVNLTGTIQRVEDGESADGEPVAHMTILLTGPVAIRMAHMVEERARLARVAVGLGWPAMTPEQWLAQREAQEREALVAQLMERGILETKDEAHDRGLTIEDLRGLNAMPETNGDNR